MTQYSSTPLFKKLGLKAGMNIELINAPIEYDDWVDNILAEMNIGTPIDFVHLFTNNLNELTAVLHDYKTKIKPNGVLWISWYKKAAKIPTEITEDIIRTEALSKGWVDVKVCSVTEQWSGLKLVIPVKDRKGLY